LLLIYLILIGVGFYVVQPAVKMTHERRLARIGVEWRRRRLT
jgi:hypothetical protein